jgi:hypothetical protein
LPCIKVKRVAQRFDVCHQVSRGVVAKSAFVILADIRLALAGASLIQQDNPVMGRIKKLPHSGRRSAPGSAVKKQGRRPRWVAAQLVVQTVPVSFEHGGLVRLNLGVQSIVHGAFSSASA